MYRDNLEALHQRSRELDRALARTAPLPPRAAFPWRKLGLSLSWIAVGAVVAWLGMARLLRPLPSPPEPPVRTEQATVALDYYGARVTAGGEERCIVMIRPPCRALITCGTNVVYRGSGTCKDGRYLDPADSWLDGTPQCVIDVNRRRAVVHDIDSERRSDSDHYSTAWQVDLELL